jgi:DNA mismatch repair protein MutS2
MIEFLQSFTKLEFDKVKSRILRYAVSDPGREHIEHLQPSSSLPEIKHNLALVTEMKQLLTGDDTLPIDNIIDIRQGLQRSSIENYFLPSDELRSIVKVLTVARNISVYFSRRNTSYPLLYVMVKEVYINKLLEYNISQAIDEEGNVKDSASKELSEIRRQIVQRNISLRKNLEHILKNVAGKDWIQEEIITTREGRMVIPIKMEHKNRVPGFIHSSSSSGATVFIEPTETLDLNNEIRELQFKEQREIEKILRILTRQVYEAKDMMMRNIQILGEIDFIHSKAKYSIEILGAEPFLTETQALRLEKAFHPILLSHHKREEVTPLDIEIGQDVNTIIITGPNAGGKSVAMKTVGLLCLMAQSGCHISASPDSVIRVFDKIFVEMGDNQSIENDLSSFSSHLRNLKLIIEHAAQQSLVLIDEIGSGTDPAEGAAIASSVLEYLSHSDCTTIVTTHHGTLKTFAFETPKFLNAAMEFNQKTLQPTYNFRSGIPGSSYAIEMAERIGLSAIVINRSREFRGNSANKLEDLILDMERKTQDLKVALDNAETEKAKFNTLNQLYENKIKHLEKELKQIKSQALNEAQIIVEKANTTIEKTVREIKETAAEKNTVRTAKQNIRIIASEVAQLQEENKISDPIVENFVVGDYVKFKNSEAVGEIVAQIDKEHYIVLIGTMKLNVHNSNLLHAKTSITRERSRSTIEIATSVTGELDLRGMYGDEAINAIEKLFDEAILSGLHRVHLIHGKGTGALRRKINDYLEKNNSIASFRLGEWNEGGSGVTVVELK